MSKRNRPPIGQYLEGRLIRRIRILTIISLAMLAVIAFEVLHGTFDVLLVLGGVIIGLVVGIIASRMFHLSWDEESGNVIGRIDWIGVIILIFYISFMIARTLLLGYLIQGAPLFAIILSITAGTMIGRVMGTRRSIKKVLKAWKIL